jgi:dimethylamine monooxygenase subunit A
MKLDVDRPLRMGLEPLTLERWLAPQEGDEHPLAERAKLIESHQQDVIAALPEADDAVQELSSILRDHSMTITGDESSHSILQSIGTSIAEDLCVLIYGDGEYRLMAAVLCFPNRWKLRDKIGRTITEIHGPVPDYALQMSGTVDRFLTKLRPLRAFTRDNWGLTASPALHQPDLAPPVHVGDLGGTFLRIEEQSFLKLPNTEAVIFAIRTSVTPWLRVPESTRDTVVRSAEALGSDWLAYKAIKT